ncbi:MAG TPA: hypothetical protein VKG92_06780 [Flavobacteriales bacterium]|nr:hypothetical protein [Flavobacteriales bacterium]
MPDIRTTVAATPENEPSRFVSILRMRCPFCRKGRFYVSHPYDLKRVGDTLDECPVCHRAYSVEYGFYMGAMYLSYGTSVLIGITTYFLIGAIAPRLPLAWHVASIGLVVLALAPLTYAYSKVLYGNIFLKYKGPQDPDHKAPVRRADRWR